MVALGKTQSTGLRVIRGANHRKRCGEQACQERSRPATFQNRSHPISETRLRRPHPSRAQTSRTIQLCSAKSAWLPPPAICALPNNKVCYTTSHSTITAPDSTETKPVDASVLLRMAVIVPKWKRGRVASTTVKHIVNSMLTSRPTAQAAGMEAIEVPDGCSRQSPGTAIQCPTNAFVTTVPKPALPKCTVLGA